MKTAVVILSATLAWALVALVVAGGVTGNWSGTGQLYGWALTPSLFTAITVWMLFRRQLSRPDIRTRYLLPFCTIAAAVPIWASWLYVIRWLSHGMPIRSSEFGDWLTIVALGLIVSLTYGLIITYPAAYLTQVCFGLAAKRKLA